eukprot:2594852-Amphidinium_carterae.1
MLGGFRSSCIYAPWPSIVVRRLSALQAPFAKCHAKTCCSQGAELCCQEPDLGAPFSWSQGKAVPRGTTHSSGVAWIS